MDLSVAIVVAEEMVALRYGRGASSMGWTRLSMPSDTLNIDIFRNPSDPSKSRAFLSAGMFATFLKQRLGNAMHQARDRTPGAGRTGGAAGGSSVRSTMNGGTPGSVPIGGAGGGYYSQGSQFPAQSQNTPSRPMPSNIATPPSSFAHQRAPTPSSIQSMPYGGGFPAQLQTPPSATAAGFMHSSAYDTPQQLQDHRGQSPMQSPADQPTYQFGSAAFPTNWRAPC
jgi:hypothetical protein